MNVYAVRTFKGTIISEDSFSTLDIQNAQGFFDRALISITEYLVMKGYEDLTPYEVGEIDNNKVVILELGDNSKVYYSRSLSTVIEYFRL